ncbi:universal stress protein [Sporichthya brevicatena]|uniref:Universal stress protein n=1 Tax=Sporichthya brevicatena TaxID=171442 RepID=A0ABN1GA36_9ACTN
MDARPVVVGYHDRKDSREALAWAADEAAAWGRPLQVLFAANYPGMITPPGSSIELEPGALDAANEVTTRGVAEALALQPDLAVSGRTEVTSPTRALMEASEDAALLVIGSRGYGPLLGTLLGSISLIVPARAACPVVVVKPACARTRPGPERRVVVGTDGSEHAAGAVEFAAGVAERSGAALEVLCSTGEPPLYGVTTMDPHEAARQILAVTEAAVAVAHPEVEVRTRLAEGPAAEVLLAAAAGAGMVVVGSRGRGAFTGMIAGSVSMAVVHGAEAPVAVV